MRDSIEFVLNGRARKVSGEDCFLNLSDYLRKIQGLTGTKVVCAEGDCGACSVLKSPPVSISGEDTQFEVVNSCILLVAQLDGCVVLTVEALGSLAQLHPIQSAMAENHASQCGFCTPGFVVALADMMESHKKPCSEQEIKNHLTGNLCRCTGYQSIIDAAKTQKGSLFGRLKKKFLSEKTLSHLSSATDVGLRFETEAASFVAPRDRAELIDVLKENLDYRILGAGTDLGVQRNKHGVAPTRVLSLHLIKELYELRVRESQIFVPARVTLSELRKALLTRSRDLSNFLDIFASPQIKNVATLVGNVANASPIADTPPFLLALNARVHVLSSEDGEIHEIPLVDFYVAYKKLKLKAGELIWAISFDLPQKNEELFLKKISQRKDLDISCVNMGFWSKKDSKGALNGLRLAIGGVAEKPIRLKQTESSVLRGASREEVLSLAQEEIRPLSDLRGSENYRRLLVHNYLDSFLEAQGLAP